MGQWPAYVVGSKPAVDSRGRIKRASARSCSGVARLVVRLTGVYSRTRLRNRRSAVTRRRYPGVGVGQLAFTGGSAAVDGGGRHEVTRRYAGATGRHTLLGSGVHRFAVVAGLRDEAGRRVRSRDGESAQRRGDDNRERESTPDDQASCR